MEENIANEILKIINMYSNNQDWKKYMESLKNEEEVKDGLWEVLNGTSEKHKEA